jgi:hypothetical protein
LAVCLERRDAASRGIGGGEVAVQEGKAMKDINLDYTHAPWYCIDETMRTNWLALFEEMKVNAAGGPMKLYAWFMGETAIIDQSITELESLDPICE